MNLDEVVQSLRTDDMQGIKFSLVRESANVYSLTASMYLERRLTEKVKGTSDEVSLADVRTSMDSLTNKIMSDQPISRDK